MSERYERRDVVMFLLQQERSTRRVQLFPRLVLPFRS
jgi:hypothetical protein